MLKSKSLTSGFTDDIIGGNDVTSGFLFFLWCFLLGFFVFNVVDIEVEVEVVVEVLVEAVGVEAVVAIFLFFDFFDFGDFGILWQFLWCPSSFIHFFRFGWLPFLPPSDLKSSFSSWFSSIMSSFNSSSRNRKVTIGYPIFKQKCRLWLLKISQSILKIILK